MRLKCISSLAVGLLSTALMSGCSNSGLETIPVAGKVATEGRAFPQICRVYFLPIETAGPKRPAFAQTSEDGSYSVSAFKDSEGLLPGTYKVNVQYMDLKPGANPELDGSWIVHRHDAGQVVVESGADAIEHNITIPTKS